jgi:AcrR family transcriptional regulator
MRLGEAVPENRGRPRIRSDEEILSGALHAFAASGYDAMSVRSLNSTLGLSHGTINQRFGSKQQLYYAAIDQGFATFLSDIAAERQQRPVDGDDLTELRETIRAFLVCAARRPELGRLMNQEGLHRSERLDYIVATVVGPALKPLVDLMARLASAGRTHRVPMRQLFFLVAHGAEAPYTLTSLSAAFDPIDGPLDRVGHAEAVTDLLMRGLQRLD